MWLFATEAVLQRFYVAVFRSQAPWGITCKPAYGEIPVCSPLVLSSRLKRFAWAVCSVYAAGSVIDWFLGHAAQCPAYLVVVMPTRVPGV
jgi:hypothetical protein